MTYIQTVYSPFTKSLYAYDIQSGDIDSLHDSSKNVFTKFIPLAPHVRLKCKFDNFLKLSNCGKFIMILRQNYYSSKCCNQFVDIRGVYGRGSEGFRSCILELCDCHDKQKEGNKQKKDYEFAEMAGNYYSKIA